MSENWYNSNIQLWDLGIGLVFAVLLVLVRVAGYLLGWWETVLPRW